MIRIANLADVPQLAEICVPYVLEWRFPRFSLMHDWTQFSVWSSWDQLRYFSEVSPAKFV